MAISRVDQSAGKNSLNNLGVENRGRDLRFCRAPARRVLHERANYPIQLAFLHLQTAPATSPRALLALRFWAALRTPAIARVPQRH